MPLVHEATKGKSPCLLCVGASTVLDERDLTPESLSAAVADLLEDPGRLEVMSAAGLAAARTQSARDIALDCLDLLR